MTADMAGLRKPFPPELIGKLPATSKRPALDYCGHAAVTDRLLQCAPGWEFRVLNDFSSGDAYWVRAALTIDGVTREEFGEGPDPKKAISDALKRCAMRFGVALDLWSKEDLDLGMGLRDQHGPEAPTSSASARSGEGTADVAGAEEGVVRSTSSEVHIHEWSDTFDDGRKTRPGWVVCACGVAEQASKVKT